MWPCDKIIFELNVLRRFLADLSILLSVIVGRPL